MSATSISAWPGSSCYPKGSKEPKYRVFMIVIFGIMVLILGRNLVFGHLEVKEPEHSKWLQDAQL